MVGVEADLRDPFADAVHDAVLVVRRIDAEGLDTDGQSSGRCGPDGFNTRYILRFQNVKVRRRDASAAAAEGEW